MRAAGTRSLCCGGLKVFSGPGAPSCAEASVVVPSVATSTKSAELLSVSCGRPLSRWRKKLCSTAVVTGATITRLRFRAVDFTTVGTPNVVGGVQQAVLSLTNSTDFSITTSLGDLTVKGTTLEEPPTQTAGGGYNSSVVVELPTEGIPDGGFVDTQFTFNVMRAGRYRIFVNVEPVLAAAEPIAPAARKTKAQTPQGARSKKSLPK